MTVYFTHDRSYVKGVSLGFRVELLGCILVDTRSGLMQNLFLGVSDHCNTCLILLIDLFKTKFCFKQKSELLTIF